MSVSWYSSMVVEEFFSFKTKDNLVKYELGPSLYLGFVSSFISFSAGSCCCCMPGTTTDQGGVKTTPNPTVGFPTAGNNRPAPKVELKSIEFYKPNRGALMEYV